MLIRNTEPHQKCSTNTPPTTEPIGTPAPKAAAQTDTAVRRWRSSWNMFRISASVDGAKVAPPMPSKARAAINISALVE
jgi:hypothetical protein